MAVSRKFSNATIILFLHIPPPVVFVAAGLLSSVIVILIPLSREEYLFSLLNTGAGLTRKSLSEDTISPARFGYLMASRPIAWKIQV